MHVSQARIDANIRNSKLSTGPRTARGKSISRANGIKHGLCSSIVVAEDVQLLQMRSEEYFDALKPQDEFQAWACDQIAVHSIRVDRVTRMERRVRDKDSLRAELTWDGDRRLEVEILGGFLSRRPPETVESLRQTPHGCDWLIARWAMLAHAADGPDKSWTDEQTALAFDLLATPAPFRVGRKPGTTLDQRGNVIAEPDDSAAFARRMIDDLEAHRLVVDDIDEAEQSLMICDVSADVGPELRRLRRYETAIHGRLRWLMEQVKAKPDPDRKLIPWLKGKWTAQAETTPAPEKKTPEEVLAEYHNPNSTHPPFNLELDELPPPGEKRDIPAILKNRKLKRQAKVDARREAERRRLERLRG